LASWRKQSGLQARRTVYVSVTQKDGAPVTDLTAADFVIKESGKPVEVVGAELTKTPIRLTMIVADGGTGDSSTRSSRWSSSSRRSPSFH
jgi:hypothetical protein